MKLVHRHLKTTRHLDSAVPEAVVEVVVLVAVAVVTVVLSTIEEQIRLILQ